MENTIDFIKAHPDIDQEELLEFVLVRIPEEDDEGYGENYLEPCD